MTSNTTFFHYSYSRNPLKLYSRRQFPNTWEFRIGKPRGLWITPDSPDNWANWCEEQEYSLGNNKYKVVLKSGANILRISTFAEIMEFTEKYKVLEGKSSGYYAGVVVNYINWVEVAKEYDGIIIAPYIYKARLGAETSWYYGWDCSSGCIWNKRAIESVELVEESEAKEFRIPLTYAAQ